MRYFQTYFTRPTFKLFKLGLRSPSICPRYVATAKIQRLDGAQGAKYRQHGTAARNANKNTGSYTSSNAIHASQLIRPTISLGIVVAIDFPMTIKLAKTMDSAGPSQRRIDPNCWGYTSGCLTISMLAQRWCIAGVSMEHWWKR